MEVNEPSAKYLAAVSSCVPTPDWKVLALGSIATIERGKFTARPRNDPRLYGGDVPFLQTGDVAHSRGRIRAFSQTLNSDGLKVSRLFPEGTLFFTIAANIGDVGICSFAAACPDSLVAISPNSDISTEWLLHELARRKGDFETLASPGAQLNINLEKLRPYLLTVPPTAEQYGIANALTDADALIDSLEQLLTKKRQIKQGAMQELLTGQRRLPGFDQPWQESKLRQLGTFLKGSGIRRDEALSGDLPCVRYGEIYTTHSDYIRSFSSWISPVVAATSTVLRQGDLLFAGSGETKEEIGKCVAFLYNEPAYAGGDIVILRPTVEADSMFLGYLLNMPFVVRQKASRGQGDAVVHISANALGEIEFELPEVAEQKAIAQVLSDMDTELTALESRLTKARALKQAMAQALLTGRIRLVPGSAA